MGGRARASRSGGGRLTAPPTKRLIDRLWSRNAAVLLARNTAVSVIVFLMGLGLLWLLVEYWGVGEVSAAAAGFVLANTLHYALGRTWIYRGTERRLVPGYAYFLINGLIGLVITLVLFAAILRFSSIHYLVARVIVSVVAGLAMFLLNATLNFRRL